MYDNLVNGRQSSLKRTTIEAKRRIKDLATTMFDPSLVNHYLTILEERPSSIEGKADYLLNCSDLQEGMELTRDIVNADKNTLLTKGTKLEQHHIDRLLDIEKSQDESFLIYAR